MDEGSGKNHTGSKLLEENEQEVPLSHARERREDDGQEYTHGTCDKDDKEKANPQGNVVVTVSALARGCLRARTCAVSLENVRFH